jgi:hypothetical protein
MVVGWCGRPLPPEPARIAASTEPVFVFSAPPQPLNRHVTYQALTGDIPQGRVDRRSHTHQDKDDRHDRTPTRIPASFRS